MSRANISSNNSSATETIPDSLREIFVTKGYDSGSHYKKNGIEYTIVENGRNTALSIAETDSYYYETAAGIYKADETFSDLSDKPLSEEEALALRGQVMQIVDREARELGLENPRTVHDRVAMYLTNWKNSEARLKAHQTRLNNFLANSEGGGEAFLQEELSQEEIVREVVSQAKINQEFNRISQLTPRKLMTDISYLAMNLVGEKDQKRPISDEQVMNVRDWLIDQNRKKQIPTMEEIFDRFNEIGNLHATYQLNAFSLGLTANQALSIYPDQVQYLQNIYAESLDASEADHSIPEITAEEIRAKFEKIKFLDSAYKLEAYNLGLTAEQASDLSKDQFKYLYDNLEEEFTEEDLRDIYEPIINLKKTHQLDAFKLGLVYEEAQKITKGQSSYLATLPAGENIQERYQAIADLVGNHQTNALRLGFSIEQARNIDSRTSNYLVGLHNNREPQESIHAAYAQIMSLNGHQAEAFQRGLNHTNAANISLEQFNATCQMGIISLPKRGENMESANRRAFELSYQRAIMAPSSSIDPDTVQSITGKRNRDNDDDQSR